jgi:hypothetical protein
LIENINEGTLSNLKDQIQDDIGRFFPLVEIMELKFNNNPDENTINFILSYRIKSFGIADQINILLQ